MAWRVQRTDSFDKWWNKERVEEGNYRFHEAALKEFQNTAVPHHDVQTCVFRNTSFECWVTRLPDKMRRQGKRGGFRLVLILDLEERILLLQGIFRRDHLDYKGSRGKHQDAYNELIGNLAKDFVEPR